MDDSQTPEDHSPAQKVDQRKGNPRLFTPRLRGGHVQTIASFLIRRRFHLPEPEERFIDVEPGVRVRCHCHWQADRANALTVIIVHGLEGSSDSQYMLGVTEKALAAGMNVIRYNQRNCGGTDALAPVLYHSGLSTDVAAVAHDVIARDGVTGLALAGFSMGGNIVLKLAGEWGSGGPPQFRAVVAVCPAIDLSISSDALHQPANRLYEKYFLWALRRRMLQKARLFPGQFDVSRLRGIQSLREFDDKITAFYCGFTGVDDYYHRASAAQVVQQIAVPTLIMYATNDPFIRITPETRRKIASNRHITFVETEDGGHCAFVGAPARNSFEPCTSEAHAKTDDKDRDRDDDKNSNDDGYWAEQEIVSFLRNF